MPLPTRRMSSCRATGGRLANLYRDAGYRTFARTGDIYQLFYERGCQILTPSRGLMTYITSNSWLKAEYGKSTRRYFAENHTPLRLLELGKDVFESAIVDSGIMVARLGKSGETGRAVDLDRLAGEPFPPPEHLWGELRPRRGKALERPVGGGAVGDGQDGSGRHAVERVGCGNEYGN